VLVDEIFSDLQQRARLAKASKRPLLEQIPRGFGLLLLEREVHALVPGAFRDRAGRVFPESVNPLPVAA
jgi:hypothetical protein